MSKTANTFVKRETKLGVCVYPITLNEQIL